MTISRRMTLQIERHGEVHFKIGECCGIYGFTQPQDEEEIRMADERLTKAIARIAQERDAVTAEVARLTAQVGRFRQAMGLIHEQMVAQDKRTLWLAVDTACYQILIPGDLDPVRQSDD